MNKPLRFLSRDDVRQSLSMGDAIGLMRDAFVQLSKGEAVVPVRLTMEIEREQSRTLLMPAYLARNRQTSVKIVQILDQNPERGLPYIQAIVLLADSETGQPLAMMDGEYLTALRTGAASGLATDLLARKDASTAAIIGAGAQARFQLEAVAKVRDLSEAFILNRNVAKAEQFAETMSAQLSFPVHVAETGAVLKQADIICTATSAREPVFKHSDLKPGAHINGIGAYKAGMCEVPAETIAHAKVVVDHRESCLAEAGDLIAAIAAGAFSESDIYAELGEIAAGDKPGRQSDTEITFFKSVGNAVQDLAAASAVLAKAEALGLGTEVSL